MDLGISRLKRLVARAEGASYESVTIYGVGHHGTFYTKRFDGPFWVKVLVDGEDATGRYPNEKLRDMYSKAGYAASVQYAGALGRQLRNEGVRIGHNAREHGLQSRPLLCLELNPVQ